MFDLVIVESPYGPRGALDTADAAVQLQENIQYLRACLADCLKRGEAPFASHAIYTQPGVLDDTKADERRKGMMAGFAWRSCAARTVVYNDLGTSPGMLEGIHHAREIGCPVEPRSLGATWRLDEFHPRFHPIPGAPADGVAIVSVEVGRPSPEDCEHPRVKRERAITWCPDCEEHIHADTRRPTRATGPGGAPADVEVAFIRASLVDIPGGSALDKVKRLRARADAEELDAMHSGGILSDVCDLVFGDPRRAETHSYDGVLEKCRELVECLAAYEADPNHPEPPIVKGALDAQEQAERELFAASSRVEELEGALAKAWSMFENSGVMREPDGRTGNAALDDLGTHLDEWAMVAQTQPKAGDDAGAEEKTDDGT